MSTNDKLFLNEDIVLLLGEDVEYDEEPPVKCWPLTWKRFWFAFYVCGVFFILFGGILFVAIWLLTRQ